VRANNQVVGSAMIDLFNFKKIHVCANAHLTLRSVLSLNNPKNNEMKICENMKLDMLKIIIIIIGYIYSE